MASCREIEPLLTPYVDEQATGSERAAVDQHLQVCERCRGKATSEAAARVILRGTAARLRSEAPTGLQARCRAPRPMEEKAHRHRAAFRPMRAWAMAAGMLLVVCAIGFTTAGSRRVLAAELTLDHVKCFALFERTSAQPDSAAVSEHLRAVYGWSVPVPGPSVPLKLLLVGGRRCFSTDGRVAHILYRHDGRPLSLFVIPSVARGAAELRTMGHRAIIWSQGGMTFAVVAREPETDLAPVAAYMRDAVATGTRPQAPR